MLTQQNKQKLFLFTIAIIGILYHFISTYGYTMDDALITLRYSLNFGDTGLPIWNDADINHPTMGFTSPLWMVLNSIQVLFTKDKDLIVTFAKLWSLCFLLGYAYLIVSIIQKQDLGFANKMLFSILLLWNPLFSFHASSGMETILFGSALSIYAFAILRMRKNYKFLVFFGLLLFLIRPEGILALGIYWLYDIYINKDYKKSFLSATIISAILIIYFYSIYKFYGYPLPSAFYVKQGGSFVKISAIKMASVFIVLSALPFLINIIFQIKNINVKKEFVLLAFMIVFFLFYLTVTPLMNVMYRYQMPVLFLLTLFFAIHAKSFNQITKIKRFSIIALIVILGVFNMGLVNKYTSKVSQASENLRKIGLFFHTYKDSNDWLAYHDAGYICYYSELNSIDTIGLNTIDIATKQKNAFDYYKENDKVKYIMQNNTGSTLSSIMPTTKYSTYGFSHLGTVPISYDGNEYYVVDIFQRGNRIKKSDLASIHTDINVRATWFDDLYYLGRRLIKNR